MSVIAMTPGPSADVILLPKALRAEWIDVIVLDKTVSHIAVRVGGVLGSYFNKRRGDAYPSIRTLARMMGVSERTVWGAIKELEAKGYLKVERRSLGEGVRTTKDGRKITVKFAGGKGVANTYFPAFERSRLFATNKGSKLAARCDHYWDHRSQNPTSEVAASCDPTLTSPSGKNPKGEDHRLGEEGDRLRARLGDDTFRAWLGGLRIDEVSATRLRLLAPSRFIADWIREHYLDAIREAWSIADVEIVRDGAT